MPNVSLENAIIALDEMASMTLDDVLPSGGTSVLDQYQISSACRYLFHCSGKVVGMRYMNRRECMLVIAAALRRRGGFSIDLKGGQHIPWRAVIPIYQRER